MGIAQRTRFVKTNAPLLHFIDDKARNIGVVSRNRARTCILYTPIDSIRALYPREFYALTPLRLCQLFLIVFIFSLKKETNVDDEKLSEEFDAVFGGGRALTKAEEDRLFAIEAPPPLASIAQ